MTCNEKIYAVLVGAVSIGSTRKWSRTLYSVYLPEIYRFSLFGGVKTRGGVASFYEQVVEVSFVLHTHVESSCTSLFPSVLSYLNVL